MNNPSTIERVVMRRVYAICVLRPFFSGLFVSSLVLVAVLFGIGREVWVAKVFTNGPQDFFGHVSYFAYAFGHTRLIVQMLSLAIFGTLIYLVHTSSRTLASVFTLEHA